MKKTVFRVKKVQACCRRSNISANKAYDADEFVAAIDKAGARALIPSKANRIHPGTYIQHLCRWRHLAGYLIDKVQHYQRIFSRFDKLSERYLGSLKFAAALI